MKQFGLIGKSLTHSFSPAFFAQFFKENHIDADYSPFELTAIEEVQTLFKNPLNGLNVTIPYKESIMPFLDGLSQEAAEIGAVNTIAFENGKKIGYNTDAYGFQQSIKPFLTNKHEKALILGTGGASKAVSYVLKSLGIEILYLSRKPVGKNRHFSYSDVNEHLLKACKLIVNTTPVGMYPNTEVHFDFPLNGIGLEHLVVDLIYNPSKTGLLHESEKRGATILNGESMLKEQALKSWDIWQKS
jgi:shikimate dehydrogenase